MRELKKVTVKAGAHEWSAVMTTREETALLNKIDRAIGAANLKRTEEADHLKAKLAELQDGNAPEGA